MDKRPNHSIRCDVASCRNKCEDCSYCSLDTISVGCGTGAANTLCCSYEEQRGAVSRAEEMSRHAYEDAFNSAWHNDFFGAAESLMEQYPGTVDNRSDSANTNGSHTFTR